MQITAVLGYCPVLIVNISEPIFQVRIRCEWHRGYKDRVAEISTEARSTKGLPERKESAASINGTGLVGNDEPFPSGLARQLDAIGVAKATERAAG